MDIANDEAEKPCRRCQYRSVHIVYGDVCLHRDGRNPNNGEPMNVVLVRALVGHCGPKARLHKPAANANIIGKV